MKKGILLVDDYQDILNIFKKILIEEGYKIYTRTNAEQAKMIVNEQEVNLVIMDYFLKNTNGVHLAEALKKIDENLQIVFLTGYHPILDTVESLGFRVERVLLKPVDIN
jgi:DNA-binding NtrC family response regulator